MDSLKNLGFYYLKEPSAFENIRTVSITELNLKKKSIHVIELTKENNKDVKKITSILKWNE